MARPAATTTFRLELECGSEPIRGTLAEADGVPVAFTGWMELAAALEAAHVACERDRTI